MVLMRWHVVLVLRTIALINEISGSIVSYPVFVSRDVVFVIATDR
jgi:hypothetical protein